MNMLVHAKFFGGSMDQDEKHMEYANRVEVQIMTYIGPPKNKDGSWPKGSEEMYMPTHIEVYVPVEIGPNEYEYHHVGNRYDGPKEDELHQM